jgi:cytochrome oxidase Cu insertion factor (SCO1/SenC/PrrC family)
MSLKERLDAYKAGFVKKVPEKTREVIQRATDELRDSGIMESALKVSDTAPDFELSDTRGNGVSLAALLERGPVVLTFFRGHW